MAPHETPLTHNYSAVKRLAGVYEDIASARDRNTEMLTDVSRALRDSALALNPAARRHSSTSTWSSRQSSLNSQTADAPRTERSAAPSPSPAEEMSSSRTRMPPRSSASKPASVTDASPENDCHDRTEQADPQITTGSELERTYTLPPLIPLSPLKPVTLEDVASSPMPLTITTSMNTAQSMPPTPPDTPTKRQLGTHFGHHNLPGLVTAPFAFPVMTELSMSDLGMSGMVLPEIDMGPEDAVTEGSLVKQSRSRMSPQKRPFSPSPPLPSVVDVNDEGMESSEATKKGVEAEQEEGAAAESTRAEAERELKIAKRRSPSSKKIATFERPSTRSHVEPVQATKPEPEQAENGVVKALSKSSPCKQTTVPMITLRDFDDMGSSSREVSLGSTVSAASTNPSSVDHGDMTSDSSKWTSCPGNNHDKTTHSVQNEEDPEVEAWLSPLREAALEALEEDTATLVDALRSFVNGLKELGSDLAALRSDTSNGQSPRKRRSTDSNIGSFNPATPYKMGNGALDDFRSRTNIDAEAQALCVKAREQLWDMKAMISALKIPRQEALLLSQAGPGYAEWARLGTTQKVGFLLERLKMNNCDPTADHIIEARSLENLPAAKKILAAVVEEAANVEFLGKVRGWEEGVEKLESEFGGLFA